jgi:MarR family 2-MHQ and catechol resistance regulon transcriptional repressor
VRRERGHDDRRCVRVRLTAAGRRRIEGLLPDHVARIVAALSPLSASEQLELGRLCRKLGLALAVE